MARPVPAGLGEGYTARAGRRFGLTVGTAFLTLAGVARWRGHGVSSWVFAVAGSLAIAGALVAPAAMGPVERAWMALAALISKVTTPVFMGIVYFVVLMPIGVIRRRFTGGSLAHRAGSEGYWADRRGTPRSSLFRQF